MFFHVFSCRFRAGACTNLSIPCGKKRCFLSPPSRPIKNPSCSPKNAPPGKPVPYNCLCHPDDHALSTFGAGRFLTIFLACGLVGFTLACLLSSEHVLQERHTCWVVTFIIGGRPFAHSASAKTAAALRFNPVQMGLHSVLKTIAEIHPDVLQFCSVSGGTAWISKQRPLLCVSARSGSNVAITAGANQRSYQVQVR